MALVPKGSRIFMMFVFASIIDSYAKKSAQDVDGHMQGVWESEVGTRCQVRMIRRHEMSHSCSLCSCRFVSDSSSVSSDCGFEVLCREEM